MARQVPFKLLRSLRSLASVASTSIVHIIVNTEQSNSIFVFPRFNNIEILNNKSKVQYLVYKVF